MKTGIHPISRKTVFQDVVTGESFLVDSTVESGESVLWSDGQTYPVIKVEISSSSHPAFNGKDVGERKTSTQAEKFRQRYSL